MREITDIEVLDDDYNVRLTFDDDSIRSMNLRPLLRGELFEALAVDYNLFRQVCVDSEVGTIVWPNGADMDPDVLHGDAEPAWASAAGAGSPDAETWTQFVRSLRQST
jgi:hypothetical protein